MPIDSVTAFDPPTGSSITIQVTLTNTGDREGEFNVSCQYVGAGSGNATPTSGFDSVSGDIGTVTVGAGQSVTLSFSTGALYEVGTYDVIAVAGTEAETVQDTLRVNGVFEIYVPPTASLSNLSVS